MVETISNILSVLEKIKMFYDSFKEEEEWVSEIIEFSESLEEEISKYKNFVEEKKMKWNEKLLKMIEKRFCKFQKFIEQRLKQGTFKKILSHIFSNPKEKAKELKKKLKDAIQIIQLHYMSEIIQGNTEKTKSITQTLWEQYFQPKNAQTVCPSISVKKFVRKFGDYVQSTTDIILEPIDLSEIRKMIDLNANGIIEFSEWDDFYEKFWKSDFKRKKTLGICSIYFI